MLRLIYVCAVICVLALPAYVRAQDDDVSLGDLAREFRKSKPPEQTEVIDNDNLTRVMDKAESERLEGQPIFSVSPSGILTTVSPDGACSLSFDARSITKNSAAYIATDLPQDELGNLDGRAVIQNGDLLVSLHNRTQWELKEIVVGFAVLQIPQGPPEYRFATLDLPASVDPEKLPDTTALYHLKGSSAPDSTAVFRAALDKDIEGAKDWHWSIVGARGIPPAATGSRSSQAAAADPAMDSPLAHDNFGAQSSPQPIYLPNSRQDAAQK